MLGKKLQVVHEVWHCLEAHQPWVIVGQGPILHVSLAVGVGSQLRCPLEVWALHMNKKTDGSTVVSENMHEAR
jgi:hypothetical protein